jgi:hypothetical protein
VYLGKDRHGSGHERIEFLVDIPRIRTGLGAGRLLDFGDARLEYGGQTQLLGGFNLIDRLQACALMRRKPERREKRERTSGYAVAPFRTRLVPLV